MKELISKRLCINCEKPGHFVADCPEKRKMSQDRVNAVMSHWANDTGSGGRAKSSAGNPVSNAEKLDAHEPSLSRIEELDSSDDGQGN